MTWPMGRGEVGNLVAVDGGLIGAWALVRVVFQPMAAPRARTPTAVTSTSLRFMTSLLYDRKRSMERDTGCLLVLLCILNIPAGSLLATGWSGGKHEACQR